MTGVDSVSTTDVDDSSPVVAVGGIMKVVLAAATLVGKDVGGV